jgi:hypothetical protein
MYEKTIGNEHRIYAITIPETPTLVIDLLSAPDRADYDALVTGEGARFYEPIEYIPNDKKFRRIPVDGYILSNANAWYVATSLAGAVEVVPIDERYTFPVSFWLNKTWISAPAPIAGTLRIFFS